MIRAVQVLALAAMVVPAAVHAQDGGARPRLEEIDRYLHRSEQLVPGGAGGTPISLRPYDWFSIEPAGAIGAEMIPVILLKVLPDLAVSLGDVDPEDPARPLFGEPADQLARFGFWDDPKLEGKTSYLPPGFSSTPGRPGQGLPVSLAVRTCAGCHTGRVRLEDGSIRVLVGAPNTELLLHQFDAALGSFFGKHLADDARTRQFADAITAAVDAKHRADPRAFFKGSPGHDAADEARQVATFKALLSLPREQGGILANIAFASGLRTASREKLKEVAYSKPNSPDLVGGPPGLVDSSGVGLAAFVVPFHLDPAEALFAGATKNDIPSVWNQATRKRFQWDANIRDELARNLVAALGLVGVPEKMDITRNVVISDFIDGLPPSPYPFAIDAALAAKGRAIYEANCAACHVPDQGRAGHRSPPVFHDLGTDPNRARVVRPLGYVAIEKALAACYQPRDLAFTYRGKDYRPNADVNGNALLVPRFAPEDQGYVAGPLDGIWARAPYLHNGSVPTLRQLLAPKSRVATFVRGVISFDRVDVGWDWRSEDLEKLRPSNPSARLYQTSQDGQSGAGHDQASWVDRDGVVGPIGRSYRLAWDDPRDPAVDALLEYLKTL